jgi:sRNA-binding carbon storage regulator CsrA
MVVHKVIENQRQRVRIGVEALPPILMLPNGEIYTTRQSKKKTNAPIENSHPNVRIIPEFSSEMKSIITFGLIRLTIQTNISTKKGGQNTRWRS